MKLKVNKLSVQVQKYISDIIQFEVKDSHIGFVTVTSVSLNNDYSVAKVYVSFINKDTKDSQLKALENAKGYIRSSLAKKLTIRKCPAIIFIEDNSFDKGAEIDNILKDLK